MSKTEKTAILIPETITTRMKAISDSANAQIENIRRQANEAIGLIAEGLIAANGSTPDGWEIDKEYKTLTKK